MAEWSQNALTVKSSAELERIIITRILSRCSSPIQNRIAEEPFRRNDCKYKNIFGFNSDHTGIYQSIIAFLPKLPNKRNTIN